MKTERGSPRTPIHPRASRRPLSSAEVKEALIRAIHERSTISFRYHDQPRVAQPQCYGTGTKGTELLRAFQVQNGIDKEALFDVAKMHDLTVLDLHFAQPGPNYRRDDSSMAVIYAQL